MLALREPPVVSWVLIFRPRDTTDPLDTPRTDSGGFLFKGVLGERRGPTLSWGYRSPGRSSERERRRARASLGAVLGRKPLPAVAVADRRTGRVVRTTGKARNGTF